MDTDLALPVSATSLGFVTTIDEPPDLPAIIKAEALASVHVISKELAIKAVDPTTSIPHRVSINEQLIKLAGLDKKVGETTPGAGVSISINIPSVDAAPPKTINISSPALDVVDGEFTIPVVTAE